MDNFDHSEHLHVEGEMKTNNHNDHLNRHQGDHDHSSGFNTSSTCCDDHESHHFSEHGHKHEHYHSAGSFNSRSKTRKRKYETRAFVVGIGGPVGKAIKANCIYYRDHLNF